MEDEVTGSEKTRKGKSNEDSQLFLTGSRAVHT
jgi:hypothetical protein